MNKKSIAITECGSLLRPRSGRKCLHGRWTVILHSNKNIIFKMVAYICSCITIRIFETNMSVAPPSVPPLEFAGLPCCYYLLWEIRECWVIFIPSLVRIPHLVHSWHGRTHTRTQNMVISKAHLFPLKEGN